MKLISTEVILWYSGVPHKDGWYLLKYRKIDELQNLLGDSNPFPINEDVEMKIAKFSKDIWSNNLDFTILDPERIICFTQLILNDVYYKL